MHPTTLTADVEQALRQFLAIAGPEIEVIKAMIAQEFDGEDDAELLPVLESRVREKLLSPKFGKSEFYVAGMIPAEDDPQRRAKLITLLGMALFHERHQIEHLLP